MPLKNSIARLKQHNTQSAEIKYKPISYTLRKNVPDYMEDAAEIS